ncbi:T9SS type A sorting domain-containing protein [Candidatus Poribacteria bacterium]|nr:T9SS type A sorting domain-containing protein [Candidatus Poribacteria bacterium]
MNRNSVVEVGDKLEVTVRDKTGERASDSFLYPITPEVIRQAVLPITLKGIGKPQDNLLLQNYPNPFNPETWIPYQLQQPTQVVIHIYDTQGGLVRTLNIGQRDAGFYQSRTRAAYWDGRNDTGERVSSGSYFYHFQAGDFSATKKMIILK